MIPRLERPRYPPPNASMSRPIHLPKLVKSKLSHTVSGEDCKWEEIETKLQDLEESVYHSKLNGTSKRTRQQSDHLTTQYQEPKKKKTQRANSEVRSPYVSKKLKLTSLI